MDLPPDVQPARKPTAVFAVCLIAAGLVLFLGNLGLFPIHRVWDLWPLIFSFVGFGRLSGRRTPGRLLVGAAFVALGVIATLLTTGAIQLQFHDNTWVISLVLIAIGVSGLARVLDGEPWHVGDRRFKTKWERRQRRRMAKMRQWGMPVDSFATAAASPVYAPTASPAESIDNDPGLSDHTMMGHIKRSVVSQSFEGGRLTSIMGNIEIDLRRAKMPVGRMSAHIELEVIMGRISLRIPDAWRVVWNGENVFGNFEDKTIPPNTGDSAPELLLTGSCTMGAIEIES